MLSGRPQREGSLKAFIHSTAGGTLMNMASFLQLTAPAEHFLCGCCHVHSQVDSGTTRELGRESGFVHLRFQQLFHLSSASRRYLCFQHTSRYWPIISTNTLLLVRDASKPGEAAAAACLSVCPRGRWNKSADGVSCF